MERREFMAMLAGTPALPAAMSGSDDQPAAAPPKPLSITLLGTGTPSPSLHRQSSGYLIEVGRDRSAIPATADPTTRSSSWRRAAISSFHMNHYFSGTEPSPAYRMACGNHRDNAVIAERAGVKTLVLTHLLGQIDRPTVREQIVHEIQQAYRGKAIWGEDLMRLTPALARMSAIESRQG